MFEQRLKKNLKVHEEVIKLVRKYFFVFLTPLIIGITFIIASFFFLYPLVRLGIFGVIGFFMILLIGVFLVFRVFIVYSFNVFIITDQRIIDIDQQGLFDRTVSETTYEKIQDVSYRRKGMLQTLFHYGSVVIQTAGQQANIELHGVRNPERIQQVIINAQSNAKEASHDKNNQPEDEV